MALVPKPSLSDLDDALVRLDLRRDGTPFHSLSGVLCPVTLAGQPTFLKVTNDPEEQAGAAALEKWNGNGAVRVLAHDGNAIVLERAGRTLRASLTDDSAATGVLCATAHELHAHSPERADEFTSLRRWFASLIDDTTPRFDEVRTIASRLLDIPNRPVLLHGDLHHENVLDGADRGWLAIDPKGLVGAREFDYCNIFTNWEPQQAVGHFDARLAMVASTADISPVDLLGWVASWSALSGIWHLEDGNEALASLPHSIMELALARLRG